MTIYHFTTHWEFTEPREKVWQEISTPQNWPQWWSCWKKVNQVGASSAIKVGSSVTNTVRGRLPYSLHFTTTITSLEPPHSMEIDSTGDLVGTGCWELEEEEGSTRVTYYWDVATTSRLFNALSRFKFVRSMIEDNHDYVMEQGYEGLRRRLQQL
jgi:uncharacterized protein YndB with AHSA1/START domain